MAWSRAWGEVVANANKVVLEDTAGCYREGRVHEDWRPGETKRLQGRVADVKQAYKPKPSSPARSILGVMAVYNRFSADGYGYLVA